MTQTVKPAPVRTPLSPSGSVVSLQATLILWEVSQILQHSKNIVIEHAEAKEAKDKKKITWPAWSLTVALSLVSSILSSLTNRLGLSHEQDEGGAAALFEITEITAAVPSLNQQNYFLALSSIHRNGSNSSNN